MPNAELVPQHQSLHSKSRAENSRWWEWNQNKDTSYSSSTKVNGTPFSRMGKVKQKSSLNHHREKTSQTIIMYKC